MTKSWVLAFLLALGCIAWTLYFWHYPGWPAQYVVIAALLMGCVSPRRPWRWAIVFGIAVFISQVIRMVAMAGYIPGRAAAPILEANTYHPSIWAGAFALVPAFAGAQLGSWCRTIVFPYFKHEQHDHVSDPQP